MIPPEQNAEFVCQMETVLEVYQRPEHPDFPVICLDEAMKQLVQETVEPMAMQPGQPKREDYQYERNGTANLFMICDPLGEWREVVVTHHRTAVDYAHILQKLVDVYYPDALLIAIVQDNLNTHGPASLYKAFEPAEAPAVFSIAWTSAIPPSMAVG